MAYRAATISVPSIHWFRLIAPGNGAEMTDAHGSKLRQMCRLLVPLLLFCLLGAPALSADEAKILSAAPATPADVAYKNGIAALHEGQLATAQKDFNLSLRLDPRHIGALLGLSEVSIRKHDYQTAGQYLKKATDIAPGNSDVKITWGHYLFFQKHYAEAETVLKEAVEIDPQSAKPHIELGNLYLIGLHDPKDAIAAYRAGLAIDPKDAQAQYALGNALVEVGDTGEAEKQFQKATRLAPKDPTMFQALGVFYASQHRFDQAIDAYSQALAVQPKFFPAYTNRGDAYFATGRMDHALNDYQAALKIVPKLADAYTKIGLIYERESKVDQAKQAYLTAINLDRKQALAYNDLAWLAATEKANLDQALVWAGKAISLAPRDANFQDTLGWVYRARGQSDKAITVLRKAATIKPENPEIFYHLGVVYSEKGRTKDAQEALSKAVAFNRDFEGSSDAKSRLAALSRQR
jgi:tetratricopeptide (TPR) repeat protein